MFRIAFIFWLTSVHSDSPRKTRKAGHVIGFGVVNGKLVMLSRELYIYIYGIDQCQLGLLGVLLRLMLITSNGSIFPSG